MRRRSSPTKISSQLSYCLIAASLLIGGCLPAQESFVTMLVCLNDESEYENVTADLQAVAEEEELRFFGAHHEDTMAGENDDALASKGRDYHFQLEGSYGLGVTAINLGLPEGQLGLGFTQGRDSKKARRIAEKVALRLSARNEVIQYADARPLVPLEGCGFASDEPL